LFGHKIIFAVKKY